MVALRRKLLRGILIPALTGGVASAFIGPFVDQGHDFLLMAAAAGIVGFIALALMLSFERLIKDPFLKRLPSVAILAISTLVDVLIIFSVMLLIFSEMGLRDQNTSLFSMVLRRDFLLGILVFGALALISQFILLLNRLIGQGVLARIIVGLYHRPVQAERFFMFLDISGSTTIAEKIGHLRFLSFLNDFFFDLSLAVEATGGEIYKYVGDEAIIVWKKKRGMRHAACLECFFKVRQAVGRRAQRYQERYGLIPEFKAGLHFGTAVIGEMGDYRMEIAYLGDAVNTTARIEGACNQLKRSLLVSGEAMDMLNQSPGLPKSLKAEYLGKTSLRGKTEKTRIFSVESA